MDSASRCPCCGTALDPERKTRAEKIDNLIRSEFKKANWWERNKNVEYATYFLWLPLAIYWLDRLQETPLTNETAFAFWLLMMASVILNLGTVLILRYHLHEKPWKKFHETWDMKDSPPWTSDVAGIFRTYD